MKKIFLTLAIILLAFSTSLSQMTTTETSIKKVYVIKNNGEALNPNLLFTHGFAEIRPGIYLGQTPIYTRQVFDSSNGYCCPIIVDTCCDTSNVNEFYQSYTNSSMLFLIKDYARFGDATGDGKTNIADITTLISRIFRGEDPFINITIE